MAHKKSPSRGGPLQFTHKELAEILSTGVFQVHNMDLTSEDFIHVEGATVDADGRSLTMFSLPVNPRKFFAKMAERGETEPLITTPAPPPRRRGKSTPKSAGETESKQRRRKRHPITKELVSAEEAEHVTGLIQKNGPKYETKLLKEFRKSGTVTL